MAPELLELLQSPVTREPLRLAADGLSLLGERSGERFHIRDGIPELLDRHELVGLDASYRRFYDLIAPVYDATLALAAWLGRTSIDAVRMDYMDELVFEPDMRLLEVGIGTGANLAYVPQHVDCYGLDLSRRMLRICRKRMARARRSVQLVLGNAEYLPFKDASFDVVLHVGGINAFNDRQQALGEMFRVAKPGAQVLVVDETAALLRRFSWLPGARRMLARAPERFAAPIDLVPHAAIEVQSRNFMSDQLYCLQFRRPANLDPVTH